MICRTLTTIAMIVACTSVFAQPATVSVSQKCNWGELTASAAVEDGRVHGRHAADPSDDGLGPESRVGLANVVNRGDLHALCEFIAAIAEQPVDASRTTAEVSSVTVDCIWGKLTMQAATTDGRKHGQHAADPSDDGLGYEPRVGLANILNRGRFAVCVRITFELIKDPSRTLTRVSVQLMPIAGRSLSKHGQVLTTAGRYQSVW